MCDQQAATYDRQWSKLSVSGDGLHLLIASIFAELPIRSRVLCVGAGTGAETIYLARRFPQSTFAVVEPSTQLLEACRHGAAEHGVTDHFMRGQESIADLKGGVLTTNPLRVST